MIIPTIRYTDAIAAVDFLERAFGFERKELVQDEDGAVVHAELRFGRGAIMVGSRREGDRFETGRAVIYVIVSDPDAHHDRAKAAGAEIIMELTDQDYGSRDYAAEDPEGNIWSFGTYDPFATSDGEASKVA
jgi:uncharacterized glyoxalase superfamily protein PhnB